MQETDILRSFQDFFISNTSVTIGDLAKNIINERKRLNQFLLNNIIFKNITAEVLTLYSLVQRLMEQYADKQCDSEISKVMRSLPKDLQEMAEAISIGQETLVSEDIRNTTVLAVYTKLYKTYYDLVHLYYLLDNTFVPDIPKFFLETVNDYAAVRKQINKEENPATYAEIEEFVKKFKKSFDIKKCIPTKIEKITRDKLILNVRASNSDVVYSLEIFPPGFSEAHFTHKNGIISHLEHPSIVKHKSTIFYPPYAILTESTDYPTLSQVIHAENQTLTPDELTIIIFEIARALQYLHSHRFVHCHFTSDCVLIKPNRLPLITGLDYAQRLSTKMSIVLPFCAYSAPETIYEPISFNEKIDIYSFTIVFYEILTQKVPFDDIQQLDLRQLVMFQDRRPLIPSKCPLASFLYRGWSRYPGYRPSFNDIVSAMEGDELLLPNCNVNAFNTHVNTTADINESALKGLLSITPHSIQQMARQEIDEYSLEIIVNVLLESEDKELIDAAMDVYNNKILQCESFTVSELVTLVRLAPKIDSVENLIVTHVNTMEDKEAFIKMLCEMMPTELSIPFYMKHLLTTEKAAEYLLSFCANKTDDITMQVADAVASKFPESDLLYKTAMTNNNYYKRVFKMIIDSPAKLLKNYYKYFTDFFNATPNSFAAVMSRVFINLGANDVASLDENGVVSNKLVKIGYTSTILDLMSDSEEYTKVVLNYVLPETAGKKSLECLRMIVEVDRFENLRSALYNQIDVMSCVKHCLQENQYEYTGAVFVGLHVPVGKLVERMDIASYVLELFAVVEDMFAVSSLLSLLVPYAKIGFENYQIIPEIVMKLLKSKETVIASRALILATVLGQSSRFTKIITTPETVEAVMRFISCGEPSFEYVAIRMLGQLAPYINDHTDIHDLINKLSLKCINERMTEAVMFIFAQIQPKLRANAETVFAQIAQSYKNSANIMQLLKIIHDGTTIDEVS